VKANSARGATLAFSIALPILTAAVGQFPSKLRLPAPREGDRGDRDPLFPEGPRISLHPATHPLGARSYRSAPNRAAHVATVPGSKSIMMLASARLTSTPMRASVIAIQEGRRSFPPLRCAC
jgi:hypothetical protein